MRTDTTLEEKDEIWYNNQHIHPIAREDVVDGQESYDRPAYWLLLYTIIRIYETSLNH